MNDTCDLTWNVPSVPFLVHSLFHLELLHLSPLIEYLELGGIEVILVEKVDATDVCGIIVDLEDGRGFDVEILGITVSSEIG